FGAATDQGLTVFVVKNVESFTLREVGAEIDRLSKAAREQRLAIHELQGGTFTITSLGKDGGMLATPIIHHPEVAILGVHKIKKTPVVIEDEDGRERIELGERMMTLQRQGRVGFYGACTGQEAAALASAIALEPSDWIFPALREGGAMLLRGFPLVPYLCQVFGNSGDETKGRQMPSHMAS